VRATPRAACALAKPNDPTRALSRSGAALHHDWVIWRGCFKPLVHRVFSGWRVNGGQRTQQTTWNRADAPDEARLKYRGIEYGIEQIGGGVWKWSASVGGMSIMGVAKGKSEAVAGAETAIDQALGAVYDDDRFVRCKLCGGWINTRSPSSLLEHRGPLPHPRTAGAEWIDDDD
jgi:hypothetical protein